MASACITGVTHTKYLNLHVQTRVHMQVQSSLYPDAEQQQIQVQKNKGKGPLTSGLVPSMPLSSSESQRRVG